MSVRLRKGGTLRGFARSRSSFDLAVQDLTGALHPLSLDDVASVTDEKRSHMVAVKASANKQPLNRTARICILPFTCN